MPKELRSVLQSGPPISNLYVFIHPAAARDRPGNQMYADEFSAAMLGWEFSLIDGGRCAVIIPASFRRLPHF